jgi:repressor LexA
MMTKLTKRQAEILALIETQLSKKGSPPTRAEIARLMGFRSPNAAEDHLRALAKKKVIELIPGTSRGIRLLKSSHTLPLITDLKRLSRLGPDRLPHPPQAPPLDLTAITEQAAVAITMPDDTLAHDGILAGDILLVQFTQHPPANSILLVRRQAQFHFEGKSANMDSMVIEGYVVGVIRTY